MLTKTTTGEKEAQRKLRQTKIKTDKMFSQAKILSNKYNLHKIIFFLLPCIPDMKMFLATLMKLSFLNLGQ